MLSIIIAVAITFLMIVWFVGLGLSVVGEALPNPSLEGLSLITDCQLRVSSNQHLTYLPPRGDRRGASYIKKRLTHCVLFTGCQSI